MRHRMGKKTKHKDLAGLDEDGWGKRSRSGDGMTGKVMG